jgi:hypothetical protein
VRHPVEAGVVMDSKGLWIIQLFYYVNIGGFPLLSLGCSKFNTNCSTVTPRRATPASTGNQKATNSTNKKHGKGERHYQVKLATTQ